MRTFIYIVTESSPKRGYNRSIRVYELINNRPEYIGYNDKITTAAYKGDGAVTCQIIADNTDLDMRADGYWLSDAAIPVINV